MDLNGVEGIDLNTLGGVDRVTVNDLTGTALTAVNVNLGATGGTTGDGQADTIVVNGTNGNDSINVIGEGTSFSVGGVPAVVNVTNSEGANDAVLVNGRGGDDGLGAFSLLSADVVHKVTLDGGAGNDIIIGSPGPTPSVGGDGTTGSSGSRGTTRYVGGGDDTFIGPGRRQRRRRGGRATIRCSSTATT